MSRSSRAFLGARVVVRLDPSVFGFGDASQDKIGDVFDVLEFLCRRGAAAANYDSTAARIRERFGFQRPHGTREPRSETSFDHNYDDK